MGAETALWRALASAVADTVYEVSGRLLTTVTATYVAAGGSLAVDGTHRWPSSGRIAVAGVTGYYATKTATTLDGLTDEDGNPGLPVGIRARQVVMDITRATTQMDDLRASFIATLAVGAQLTMLARNYGINRPRGLSDTIFRDLFRAMAYLDAQTIRGCVKVLDALLGPGNYTLYEDLMSDPLTVHVILPAAASSQHRGKSYLIGGEAQATGGPNTVTADFVPEVIYGVYASTDPFREGANYANSVLACLTLAADPTRLHALVPTFTPAMEGLPAFLGADLGHWKIVSYLDPVTVQLGWDQRMDGTLRSFEPDILETDEDWFAGWVVGQEIVVDGVNPANNGIFTISERLSKFRVRLSGAAFVSESDVPWTLRPAFADDPAVTAEVPGATHVGKVITSPQVMPANVLLDYTTVPSAQQQEGAGVDGNDAYPFYLWDQGALVQVLLDLITAAGVRVVVEVE